MHKLKVKISQIHIGEEKDFEEIREWTKSVDDKLEALEPLIEEMENSIKELQDQELERPLKRRKRNTVRDMPAIA